MMDYFDGLQKKLFKISIKSIFLIDMEKVE